MIGLYLEPSQNAAACHYYRACAHVVMAATLVFQNIETVGMLVNQTNPVGVRVVFI